MTKLTEVWVDFTAVFCVTSLAGLSAALKAGDKPTWASCISAAMNAGFMGLAIFAMFYDRFKDSPWPLLGLCILSGLGGSTLLDFILTLIRQGGVNIDIRTKPHDAPPNRKDDAQ